MKSQDTVKEVIWLKSKEEDGQRDFTWFWVRVDNYGQFISLISLQFLAYDPLHFFFFFFFYKKCAKESSHNSIHK